VLRIAAFGDSFVYGSEVANDDAWPYLLEANDGLEVLNYGVPAYGLDQAYLRYEVEGDAYHPSVILVGFSPPVFPRLVSVYRRFFNNADIPLFKPRFAIEASGELSLLASPVQSRAEYEGLLARPRDVIPLGRNDSWYEPLVYRNPLFDYSALVRLGAGTASRLGRRLGRDRVIADGVFNPDSTAFTIQMKLFAMFAALAERRHTRLLVVLLPDYRTIGAFRRGEAAVYTTIADALRAARIESVDAAEIFRGAADVDQWFATGGHYSARGNRMIAAWLGGVIRDRFGPAGSRPAARRPSAHHAR
jgi:hypothetical protein